MYLQEILTGQIPIALSDISTGTPNLGDYRILEWIGYENDGFVAQNPPGWSGFTDLSHPNTVFASIETTGSDLTFEQTVLGSLFPGSTPAILFSTVSYKNNLGVASDYNALCMYTGVNGCIFPVNIAGTTLTFTGVGDRVNTQMIYNEFYKLAASAYAVVPDTIPHQVIPGGTNVWDLNLAYNYQPWQGENYATATSSLLLKNVSVFRFTQEASSLRIKLCVIEAIGDTELSICKEKAVIR